ncbi:16S rRNA (cytidine(1402)-2'-O)-methyltransferase [Paracoccus suum]|uniref:Ribosomal RNA small subunit methyltransferase I n=2 Tax=Paracoccus suum TaxID=2259340 RepID=A0A344PNQ8_9RHOB|nr:16S rRNA (cytidine(1402)-2'-O)-methyltransferase [Paracoccus suum]
MDRHAGGEDRAEPVPLSVLAERAAPGLYLVSTPIGAARDITLRALDLMNTADVLAAEDTRTLRHLLSIHGIPLRGRRLLAYHQHNETSGGDTPILAALAGGAVVAYASEAGTPLVSDPGFRLARGAIAQGAQVFAAPGASAVLAALAVSGLPSDRFLFAGFPPATDAARNRWLDGVLGIDATVIAFESPRRVKEFLRNLCEKDGERGIVICRELTKRFEEVLRGTAAELARDLRIEGMKGEVVVLIDRKVAEGTSMEEARKMVAAAMKGGLSMRDAAQAVAEASGLPRRAVYQAALAGGGE